MREERMARFALRAATARRRAVIARLRDEAVAAPPADVTVTAGDDGVVLEARGLRARAWGRAADPRLRGLGA